VPDVLALVVGSGLPSLLLWYQVETISKMLLFLLWDVHEFCRMSLFLNCIEAVGFLH
jgi:hypothetical protein